MITSLWSGDMGVIWCNSLGDSLFYILCDEFCRLCNWLLFTYHLTCISSFASCTHYTSYSLLNFVHVIVCVYGLTIQILQLLRILCKIKLLLENLWRMQEILILGILGLNSCFWKSYHHILMHFVPHVNALSCSKMYFQNFFFSNFVSLCPFRLIQPNFQSIESVLKLF